MPNSDELLWREANRGLFGRAVLAVEVGGALVEPLAAVALALLALAAVVSLLADSFWFWLSLDALLEPSALSDLSLASLVVVTVAAAAAGAG